MTALPRPAAAALAGALLWLAAACTTPPRDAGPLAAGRLSLRVEATAAQPAQSLTAAFELRGDGIQGELRLFTPLGTQVAQARWAPGRATLTTADGERSFADLEALAVGALGEPVPLGALPDWLRGRAEQRWPSAVVEGGFEQRGWSIDLRGQAEGRIVARRTAPPAVTLRVQLDGPAD